MRDTVKHLAAVPAALSAVVLIFHAPAVTRLLDIINWWFWK